MSDKPETISFDDFAKLDLRVALVVDAVEHPDADKLLLLKVDLGAMGTRQIVAGLKKYYPDPRYLVGKRIIVVANLAPRTMRGQTSEGMLLAASNGDHSQVIILTTDEPIGPGSSVG